MTEQIFTVHVPLRWGDMDAYGHVNNVAIVQIMEEARIAVFGCPPSSGDSSALKDPPPITFFEELEDGVQALIADHSISYRKPLPYRGIPARVELKLTKVTAASVLLSYSIFDQETGDLCTSATTTLAFYNAHTGTLQRLSSQQRTRLGALVVKS